MGLGWEADPDMEARDPNNLNDHLKVQFEEVLGEPEGTHAIDCVWKFSYKCFNLWKNLCYIIMTTICGIPLAMCWGCYFACIAFEHIWQITPCIKAWEINLSICARVYSICVNAFCGPCCEGCAKIFEAFRK